MLRIAVIGAIIIVVRISIKAEYFIVYILMQISEITFNVVLSSFQLDLEFMLIFKMLFLTFFLDVDLMYKFQI